MVPHPDVRGDKLLLDMNGRPARAAAHSNSGDWLLNYFNTA